MERVFVVINYALPHWLAFRLVDDHKTDEGEKSAEDDGRDQPVHGVVVLVVGFDFQLPGSLWAQVWGLVVE